MKPSAEWTPTEYQMDIYAALLKHKRRAVFSFMGSGKTVTTLTAMKELNAFPALIIAPLRVAKTTWTEEVSKWNHLSDIKAVSLTGTLKQRERALEESKDAQIVTINYEGLPWLIEHYGKDWPFKTIIADESTRLKGFRLRQGSQRAKALAKVAHTLVDRMILLTGTPAPNGLLDLWGQLWFVDKGEALGKSYSAYQEKWFESDYMGYTWTPKSTAQAEIEEKIKGLCTTIKAEDYIKLDQPLVNKIYVKLPEKARKIYNDMAKTMFSEMADTDLEVFNAAAKTMKCRQIASGTAYSDEGAIVIHDEKLQALESIIEENSGAPILVAYHFVSELEELQKRFKQGVALDKDPATIRKWNSGKIPLLFIHPASAGLGLNLQDGGNILVFYTSDWNLENHIQTIERIGPARQRAAGHNRPVFIHYLLAGDTIDENIYTRLSTKKSTQEVLLDALKLFKGR